MTSLFEQSAIVKNILSEEKEISKTNIQQAKEALRTPHISEHFNQDVSREDLSPHFTQPVSREELSPHFTQPINRIAPIQSNSPVVSTDEFGVNKHEDGTFSYTDAQGYQVENIKDGVAAQKAKAYADNDYRAVQLSAPTPGSLHSGFNALMAGGAELALNKGVASFIGSTALAARVDNHNKLTGDNITQEQINYFQELQTKPVLFPNEREFLNSKEGRLLQDLQKKADKSLDQYTRLREFTDKVKDDYFPVNNRESAAAYAAFKHTAKEEGLMRALYAGLRDDAWEGVKGSLDRIFYTLALSAGVGATQGAAFVAVTRGTAHELTQEFREVNGREPTMDETSSIMAYATMSSLIEKIGGDIVVGAFPMAKALGTKNFTNMVMEGASEAVKNTFKGMFKKLPTEAVKEATKRTVAGTAKNIVGAMASEAGEEAAQSYFEQKAVSDDIDTSEIAFSGMQGALGTIGTGASLSTAGMSVNLAKQIKENIKINKAYNEYAEAKEYQEKQPLKENLIKNIDALKQRQEQGVTLSTDDENKLKDYQAELDNLNKLDKVLTPEEIQRREDTLKKASPEAYEYINKSIRIRKEINQQDIEDDFSETDIDQQIDAIYAKTESPTYKRGTFTKDDLTQLENNINKIQTENKRKRFKLIEKLIAEATAGKDAQSDDLVDKVNAIIDQYTVSEDKAETPLTNVIGEIIKDDDTEETKKLNKSSEAFNETEKTLLALGEKTLKYVNQETIKGQSQDYRGIRPLVKDIVTAFNDPNKSNAALKNFLVNKEEQLARFVNSRINKAKAFNEAIQKSATDGVYYIVKSAAADNDLVYSVEASTIPYTVNTEEARQQVREGLGKEAEFTWVISGNKKKGKKNTSGKMASSGIVDFINAEAAYGKHALEWLANYKAHSRNPKNIPTVTKQDLKIKAKINKTDEQKTADQEAIKKAVKATPKTTETKPTNTPKETKTDKPIKTEPPVKQEVKQPSIKETSKLAVTQAPKTNTPKPQETKADRITLPEHVTFTVSKTSDYPTRTKENASADSTIAIASDFNTAGERLTKNTVKFQKKQYIPVSLDNLKERITKLGHKEGIRSTAEHIAGQLEKNKTKSLNIAGNGIYTLKNKYTQEKLDNLVYELISSIHEKYPLLSIRTGGQSGIDEAGAKAGIRLGIPTRIHAPSNWMYKNEKGETIYNEAAFKNRFIEAIKQAPKTKTTEDIIPVAKQKQAKPKMKYSVSRSLEEAREKVKDTTLFVELINNKKFAKGGGWFFKEFLENLVPQEGSSKEDTIFELADSLLSNLPLSEKEDKDNFSLSFFGRDLDNDYLKSLQINQEYLDNNIYALVKEIKKQVGGIQFIATTGHDRIGEALIKAAIQLNIPVDVYPIDNFTFINTNGEVVQNEIDFKNRFNNIYSETSYSPKPQETKPVVTQASKTKTTEGDQTVGDNTGSSKETPSVEAPESYSKYIKEIENSLREATKENKNITEEQIKAVIDTITARLSAILDLPGMSLKKLERGNILHRRFINSTLEDILGKNVLFQFINTSNIPKHVKELSSNIKLANKLEKEGKSAQEIFEKTKLYKSKEGEWRVEIPDHSVEFFTSPEKLQDMFKDAKKQNKIVLSYKLSEFLKHDELFSIFPELKEVPLDINLTPIKGLSQGNIRYDTKSVTIDNNGNVNIIPDRIPINVGTQYLDSDSKTFIKNIKETIFHEIQHIIQIIEGNVLIKDAGGHIIYNPEAKKEVYDKQFIELEAGDVGLRALRKKSRDTFPQHLLSTSRKEVYNRFMIQEDNKKGAIEFTSKGALIHLFKNADISTVVHELGHMFLYDLAYLAFGYKDETSLEQINTIRQWVGWDEKIHPRYFTDEQQEKFAKAFEKYLLEGKAPTNRLKKVFESFKKWLRSIYKSTDELDIELTPEIRDLFDSMFKTTEVLPEHTVDIETVSEKDIKKSIKKIEKALTIDNPIDADVGESTTPATNEESTATTIAEGSVEDTIVTGIKLSENMVNVYSNKEKLAKVLHLEQYFKDKKLYDKFKPLSDFLVKKEIKINEKLADKLGVTSVLKELDVLVSNKGFYHLDKLADYLVKNNYIEEASEENVIEVLQNVYATYNIEQQKIIDEYSQQAEEASQILIELDLTEREAQFIIGNRNLNPEMKMGNKVIDSKYVAPNIFNKDNPEINENIIAKTKKLVALNLSEVDNFTDLVNSEDTFINTIPEYFLDGKHNNLLKEALMDRGLKAGVAEFIITKFHAYKQRAKETFLTTEQAKKERFKNYIENDMTTLLYRDVDGISMLPDHVLLAMSIAVESAVQDYKGRGETDKSQLARLFLGDQHATLTAEDLDVFSNYTNKYDSVANLIGNNIYQLLGFYPNTQNVDSKDTVAKDAIKELNKKLRTTLGQHAIEIANIASSEVGDANKQAVLARNYKFIDHVAHKPKLLEVLQQFPSVLAVYNRYKEYYTSYYKSDVSSPEAEDYAKNAAYYGQLLKNIFNAAELFKDSEKIIKAGKFNTKQNEIIKYFPGTQVKDVNNLIKNLYILKDYFISPYTSLGQTGTVLEQVSVFPTTVDEEGNRVFVNDKDFHFKQSDGKPNDIISSIVKELKLQQSPNSFIAKEPPRGKPTYVSDMYNSLPKDLEKKAIKLQNTPWYKTVVADVAANIFNIASSLNKTNSGVLEKLQETLFELKPVDGVHKDIRKTNEASNKDKLRDWSIFMDNYKKGVFETPTYFSYGFMKNNRLLQQGLLSPQRSSIVRHLLRSHEPVTYNEDNLYLFKAAVVYNFKGDLSNLSKDEMAKYFNNLVNLKVDYTNKAGVKTQVSLMELAKEVSQLSNVDNENNVETINKLVEVLPHLKLGKDSIVEGMHLLQGLVALGDYYDYHTGKADSFNSEVSVEIDGKTNGFAIGLMQFPLMDDKTLELFLNYTRTFFLKGNKELSEAAVKLGKDQDAYNHLGTIINDIYSKSKTVFQAYYFKKYQNEVSEQRLYLYDKANKALDYVFFNTPFYKLRDFAKNPLMIFLYGAGIFRITNALAIKEILMEGILPQIGDLQREYNAEQNKQEFINTRVIPFQKALQQLTWRYNAEHQRYEYSNINLVGAIKNNTALKLALPTELLIDNITNVLSPRIDYSLTKMVGQEVMDSRNAVMEAVSIVVCNFVKKLQAKEKEFLDNLPKDAKMDQVPVAIRKSMIKELSEHLPQTVLPFMNDGEFLALVDEYKTGIEDKFSTNIIKFRPKGSNKVRSKQSTNYINEFNTESRPAPLVGGIQNIDSYLLMAVMDKITQLVPLFDAIMTSPVLAEQGSELYGKAFVDMNMKYSLGLDLMNRALKVMEESNQTKTDAYIEMLKQRDLLQDARNRLQKRIDKEGAVSLQMTFHTERGLSAKSPLNAVEELNNELYVETSALASEALTSVKTDYTDASKTKITEDILSEELFTDTLNTFKEGSKTFFQNTRQFDQYQFNISPVVNAVTSVLHNLGDIRVAFYTHDKETMGKYYAKKQQMEIYLGKNTRENVFGQSNQEVFLHETIHAVASVLDNMPLVKERVHKLFKNTLDAVSKQYGTEGYMLFLEGINNPDANDIDLAKRMYDTVFNSTEHNTKINEFFAYALSNPALMDFLSKQNYNQSTLQSFKDIKWNNLLNAFVDVLGILGQYLTRLGRNMRNKDAQVQAVVLFEHMTRIHNKNMNKYKRTTGINYKFNKILDKSDSKIRHIADKLTRKYSKRYGFLPVDVLTASLGIGRLVFTDSLAQKKAYDIIYKRMLKEPMNIVNEVLDRSLTPEQVTVLGQNHHLFNKLTEEYKHLTHKIIADSFISTDYNKLSRDTKRALTDVVLKTDLQSIVDQVDITSGELINILDNVDAINVKKKAILSALTKTLGNQKHTNELVPYANELGQFIVTHKAKMYDSHLNVMSIFQKVFPKASDKAHKLLDAYVSLVALENLNKTNSRSIILAKELFQKEYTANADINGFTNMLLLHRNYIHEVKSGIFANNPNHVQKGYIRQTADTMTDLQFGDISEKESMRKKLYKMYELPNVTGSKNPKVMYVSKWQPQTNVVGGLLQATSLNQTGTLVSEILMNDKDYQDTDGNPDWTKINIKLASMIKEHLSLANKGIVSDDVHTVPLRDTNGDITDLRVIMSYENKESRDILGVEREFHHVFGDMQASKIHKENALSQGMKAVDTLIQEQQEVLPLRPNAFVNILDKDSKYRDQYQLLSAELKKYIVDHATDGKFMIREEIVHKVLPYVAKDIKDLKILNRPGFEYIRDVAVFAQYALKTLVGAGTRTVIAKYPQVFIGNTFSGIKTLSHNGVPVTYTLAKIKEGFDENRRYQKDRKEYSELKLKLDMLNVPVNDVRRKKLLELDSKIKNNNIHRLFEAGIQTMSPNEVDVSIERRGVFHRRSRDTKLEEVINKTPRALKTITSELFMLEGSKGLALATEIVTLTDFLSRYAYIEYNTKVKGREFNVVKQEAIDLFVNFDMNMSPWMNYLNTMGITWFLKYHLRNIAGMIKSLKMNPTLTLTAAIASATTGVNVLGNYAGTPLMGKWLPAVGKTGDIIKLPFDIHLLEAFEQFGNPFNFLTR